MKRLVRGVALTVLGLTAAACGSAKYYTLAADPYRVQETQTQLGACATQLGLESYNGEDVLNVKYDDTSSLYYRYAGGGSYQLTVLVDDKKVPAAQMDSKQAAVKAKGDEIYACAQDRLNPRPQAVAVAAAPPPPPPPPPQATGMSFNMRANMDGNNPSVSIDAMTPSGPASSSASASGMPTASGASLQGAAFGGTCRQAVDCYADVAKLVCPKTATKCSFKAEIKGNDENGCRDAIAQVPQMLQMYPGNHRLPESCKVR